MIDSIHFSRIAFLAEGLPFAGQSTHFFMNRCKEKEDYMPARRMVKSLFIRN